MTRTIVLTSRQGRTITLTVEGGIIKEVDNQSGVHFPFVKGWHYNRSVATWAETHNFLFDGVDLEKKHRKIFGIPINQIPQGHKLRLIYPSKFR